MSTTQQYHTLIEIVNNLINRIQCCRETQNEIDSIYENLCEVIKQEMNDKIPQISSTKRTRKWYKHTKPYWNNELQNLWNNMNLKERNYLKSRRNNQVRRNLHNEYIRSRNVFNKLLRQCERSYRRNQAIDIDKISTSNPNEFWQKNKQLGPRKDNSIPFEIIVLEVFLPI